MAHSKRIIKRHERGFALYWLVAFLFVLAILAKPLSIRGPDNTGLALQEAKQALLGYALVYPEHHQVGNPARSAYVPGHLPCPNLEVAKNPGQEAISCGTQGVSALGRIPWTTLGLPPLLDTSGECLWYAVSGNHKSNPKADLLNVDTQGQLRIVALTAEGQTVTLADDVVAVVFAPGPPKAGQSRPFDLQNRCSSPLLASQYLESFTGGSNASLNTEAEGISTLLQVSPLARDSDSLPNDRLLWITRNEWAAAIRRRAEFRLGTAFFAADASSLAQAKALTQRVTLCLRTFALSNQSGRLPWAAALSLGKKAPDTFKTDSFPDSKNLVAGRLPMTLWQSRQALLDTSKGGGINSTLLGSLNQCTSSTSTHCRLFRTDNCSDLLAVAGYPTPSDSSSNRDSPDGWLEKWKDHLFYAVASDFQPANAAAGTCQSSNSCLSVNGRNYAAVVLFAGDPLSSQKRLELSDKSNVANYLEGVNATSISGNGSQFVAAGNDLMVCLRPDLSLASGCLD